MHSEPLGISSLPNACIPLTTQAQVLCSVVWDGHYVIGEGTEGLDAIAKTNGPFTRLPVPGATKSTRQLQADWTTRKRKKIEVSWDALSPKLPWLYSQGHTGLPHPLARSSTSQPSCAGPESVARLIAFFFIFLCLGLILILDTRQASATTLICRVASPLFNSLSEQSYRYPPRPRPC